MAETHDVGYAHVLTEPGGECRADCSHPSHRCPRCGRTPAELADHARVAFVNCRFCGDSPPSAALRGPNEANR